MATHQRILIARRAGDGLVHIGALENPSERIRLFQSNDIQLEQHVTTRPTPHSQRIVAGLKRRFETAALDVAGPWFIVDYDRAIAALTEYDLDTGDRLARDDLKLATPVSVEGVGEGVITGFALCGRIEVSIARYPKGVLTTYAPASRVHALS